MTAITTPKVTVCDPHKVPKVDPCAVNPCLTKTLSCTSLTDPSPPTKTTCSDLFTKTCGTHLPVITTDPPTTTDPGKGAGCSGDPKTYHGCGGLVGNHDGCTTHPTVVCHTTTVIV